MADEGAQVRIRSQIDPPCSNHLDTEAVFVCEVCEEALACPKCIVKGGFHCGHSFTLLQDLLDASKTEVLEFNRNTRGQVLSPLKKMSKKVAADLLAYEDSTSILQKEIEKRGDQLHLQVDQLVNEYKERCGETRASNLEVLKQYQHDLLAKIAEVEQDITTLEGCIQATCKADIINAAKTGISKTYPSIDYPTDVDVSFQQSEIPLQDMKRFLGRILIGNKPTVREETDEDKIKRMKSKIQELTYRKETDQTRIQTLQANTDGLTRKLQDQKKDSEKREKQMTQKIKELESRLLCSGCGRDKETCGCKTCPKCSYKGNDFTRPPYSFYGPRYPYLCPKCNHTFEIKA